MRKILKEKDIVLQNMVQLALKDPMGGQKFANQVLNALPDNIEFQSQFSQIMRSNLRR